MSTHLSNGPVIRRRVYPAPEDGTTIDLYYDPLIRAELLVDVLGEYARNGEMPQEPQDPGAGETYYIIHPVLKHIAILSCKGSRRE